MSLIKKSEILRKIIFLFFLLLLSALKVNAQSTMIGKLYNKDKTYVKDKIEFSYEHNLDNLNNIYVNKYYLFNNHDIDNSLLNIEIDYDLQNNTISFIRIDKNYQRVKFHNTMILKNTTPTCCVKDYQFNDTTFTPGDVNGDKLDVNDDIVFTIIDNPMGTIYLHQIKLDSIYYRLDPLLNEDFTAHINKALKYWRTIDSTKKEKDKLIYDSLKRYNDKINAENAEIELIKKDANNLIENFNAKEKSLEKITTEASDSLQSDFNQKMDSIFTRLCRNNNDTNHFTINGKYEITQQLDTIKIIKFIPINKNIDTTSIGYLTKQNIILSEIKKMFLENVSKQLNNNPYDSIYILHKSRCLKNDINPYDKLFNKSLKSLKDTINSYNNKHFKVFTVYNYSCEFSSICNSQKCFWKNNNFYDKKRDGNIIKIDKEPSKSSYKSKNGKYTIILNKINFKGDGNNNSFSSTSLISNKRTYKFSTHIGVSAGTFLNNNSLYWNLFFIRHHLGFFFGGGEYNNGGAEEAEGGIYLAPSNYFYFKAGVSYINNSISDTLTNNNSPKIGLVIGGSLVFPVIHIEAGYNTAISSPYFMGGLNIPINR